MQSELNVSGYTVVPNILTSQQATELRSAISKRNGVASRTMLKNDHIFRLALNLSSESPILDGLTPVLASYLPKSQKANWFVAKHRDETLPIESFHPEPGWSSPTVKEGIPHAKAPKNVLAQCIALRLQLTNTTEGGLNVVPGSHENSEDNGIPIPIPVPLHGGLFMRPLLVHSSAKVTTSTTREILHILYGPASLPEPFKWYSFAA